MEDTLFCVPRNAFERPNGNFFSDTLFSIPGPGGNGEQMEGRDDKHPILLAGVVKEHFRGFLRAMYPLWVITDFCLAKSIDYIHRSNGTESNTKYEDWVGVLHLATMWGFSEVSVVFRPLWNIRTHTDSLHLDSSPSHPSSFCLSRRQTSYRQDPARQKVSRQGMAFRRLYRLGVRGPARLQWIAVSIGNTHDCEIVLHPRKNLEIATFKVTFVERFTQETSAAAHLSDWSSV